MPARQCATASIGLLTVEFDMIADQLHRHRTAAFVRNVRHLLAGRFFKRDRDDLVFLLGAGAAHLELIVGRCLDRGDVLFHRLVRLVGIDPQDELVERHHCDRS